MKGHSSGGPVRRPTWNESAGAMGVADCDTCECPAKKSVVSAPGSRGPLGSFEGGWFHGLKELWREVGEKGGNDE